MDDPTQIIPKVLHKQINAYKISLTLVFIWLISYTLYQSLRETNIDDLFALQIIELPVQGTDAPKIPSCKEPCVIAPPSAITFSTFNMEFSINDLVLQWVLNDEQIKKFKENINNKYNKNSELLIQAKTIAVDSIQALAQRRAAGSRIELYTTQSLARITLGKNSSTDAKLIFNLDYAKSLIETYDNWSDDNARKERDVTLSLITQ